MDAKLLKEKIFSLADELQPLFEEVCDTVFHHPELGMQEFWTSDYLVSMIEKEGVSVEKPFGGIETAFCHATPEQYAAWMRFRDEHPRRLWPG